MTAWVILILQRPLLRCTFCISTYSNHQMDSKGNFEQNWSSSIKVVPILLTRTTLPLAAHPENLQSALIPIPPPKHMQLTRTSESHLPVLWHELQLAFLLPEVQPCHLFSIQQLVGSLQSTNHMLLLLSPSKEPHSPCPGLQNIGDPAFTSLIACAFPLSQRPSTCPAHTPHPFHLRAFVFVVVFS